MHSSHHAGRVRADKTRRLRVLSAVLGLGLLALLSLPAKQTRADWPFHRGQKDTNWAEKAPEILSEAIQIPTVNPPGNEAALVELFARLLEEAGVEHRILTTPSEPEAPARAALWARVPGRGTRPGLILLSHLDTVPADPSEWTVPPFEGRVSDGYVWGRGALDAKGVAVTHLLTLLELAQAEVPLDRDVIFLGTPDEETGGRLGAGWLAKNSPALFHGAGYLLTEGGGIQASESGPSVWGVTLTEKAPCWLELSARGRGGHSSSPSPDAAVPRLIAALDRIRRFESPVRVDPVAASMFSGLAPLASEWDQAAFLDLDAALKSDSAFRKRFLSNPSQNALVRNTISITVLEGAPKTNVAPSVARAQLDVRLLPGQSCEAFAAEIGQLIDEPSIEIETLLSFPAAASPADTPLFRAIEQVADQQTGEALVVPRLIGGFTDAHWFRELGLVAYGFVPRSLAREDARRVHGVDERAEIRTLVRGIELTSQILRELDRVEASEGDPPDRAAAFAP